MPHSVDGNGQDNTPGLDPGNLACISLLEQVLADAKQGRITTIGIIACGPSDFGATMAGPDARSLYMGCGVLQRSVLDAVTGPGNAAQQRSNIIRPGSPMRPRPVPR